MTYEERKRLYEALRTIKDVCRTHGSCVGCPMYNDKKDADQCCQVVRTVPAVWTLNNPSDWRAIL